MSSEGILKIQTCINETMVPKIRSLEKVIIDKIDKFESINNYNNRDILIRLTQQENLMAHLIEGFELLKSSFGGNLIGVVPSTANGEDSPVVLTGKVRKAATKTTKVAAVKPTKAAVAVAQTPKQCKNLTEYISYQWKTNDEFRNRYRDQYLEEIEKHVKKFPVDISSRYGIEGKTFSTRIVQAKGDAANKPLNEELVKEYEAYTVQFNNLALDTRDSDVDIEPELEETKEDPQ